MIPLRSGICRAFVLAISISLALPAFAFEYPLSSTAIRDACLRGTEQNSGTAGFLAPYTQNFSAQDGPYISSIAVVTPYLQVYRRATQGLGYSSQQAVQDFLGKPATLNIEVTIMGVPSNSPVATGQGVGLQVPDLWHNYKIIVSQGTNQIQAANTSASMLISTYTPSITGAAVIGIVITLQFDPTTMDSTATKIKILAPNGQKTKATFDLGRLK